MARVQPPDKLSHRSLIVIRQPAKLHPKSIRSCMMNYFACQRQRVFTIKQQQTEVIANLDVRTRWQVRHPQTTETDVLRLADAERFFQTFVFNRERQSR